MSRSDLQKVLRPKVDYERVKHDSTGRWEGIYSALGVGVGDGRHTSCPICGGKDRFRMDDKDGRGTWICNHCGAGDGWELLHRVLGTDFKSSVESVAGLIGGITYSSVPKKERTADPTMLRKMFESSEPATRFNMVGRYLKKRGLSVVPSVLRYLSECYETETKEKHSAMLAVFSLVDGTAVTMHRTYLGPDGKLDIEQPKKIMPTLKKMTGGAVRLFPIGDDGVLAIAEGIETAIAVHQDMKIPCWPVLSTALMEGFEPPKGVKRLIICGDNDRNFAGQKSAYNLANRLSVKNKFPVEVRIPEQNGCDWLDILNRNQESGVPF